MAVLAVVLAAIGAIVFKLLPWVEPDGLRNWLWDRREARRDIAIREDDVLDEFAPPSLPDR